MEANNQMYMQDLKNTEKIKMKRLEKAKQN